MSTTSATSLPSSALPTARTRARAPRWTRLAPIGLLLATALLYLVGLGESGWANSFYSAAAEAASVSWKALLFGSSDAANAITVDKTPGALWIIGLSVRIFGVNPWSVLVPQAIEGVATVAVLHATVRRVAGPAAGLLAGAVCALTPVAVLMFRFNNPDALLLLLLVAAAYALTRAVEAGRLGWLVLAGTLVGFGFLAKMMQAFLVLPVFALVYLLAAPGRPLRRIGQLAVATGALVLAAGWYVLLVSLWPVADRPYIGGTQQNSILELALGYNGFGRLTGQETGGLGNTNFDTGIGRLLGEQMGTQIGWLLPAALILALAGLVLIRRAGRSDRVRAALVLWLGWLLVTGVVFSFAQGILHPYYTVALAPAIGGCVGIGGVILWRRKDNPLVAATLAVTTLLTAILAAIMLARTPDWLPWLGTTIAVLGVLAALLLLALRRLPRRIGTVALALAVLAGMAAPTAYALDTAATPHSGAIPSAGPASGRFPGFGGKGGHGHGFGRRGGFGGQSGPGGQGGPGGQSGPGGQGGPGGQSGPGGQGGFGGRNAPGGPGGAPNGPGKPGGQGAPGRQAGPGGFAGKAGGWHGMGGLFGSATPGPQITAALKNDHGKYRWVAATVGSNSASGYQLATGYPVLALGGYNGTDPSPTLLQFQQLVARKEIHYFIGSGDMGIPQQFGHRRGGTDTTKSQAQQISRWVSTHFRPSTIGGVTVYALG